MTSPEAEEQGGFDFAASYANSELAVAANAMVAKLRWVHQWLEGGHGCSAMSALCPSRAGLRMDCGWSAAHSPSQLLACGANLSTAKAVITPFRIPDYAAPVPPSSVCSEPAPGAQDLKYQDLEVVSHWVQTRELLVRNFRWVC